MERWTERGMQEINISAIAFQEGDVWVVQGIEYDIVTHASNPAEIPDALMKALVENVCITQQLGREPLAGIKPAPQRFKDMFDIAVAQVRSIKREISAQAPIGELDIRLANAAA